MKFKLSQKAKFIGGIIIVILLVLSGTIFGLAKVGVINIRGLADGIASTISKDSDKSGTVTVNISRTNTGQSYDFSFTGPDSLGGNLTNSVSLRNVTIGTYSLSFSSGQTFTLNGPDGCTASKNFDLTHGGNPVDISVTFCDEGGGGGVECNTNADCPPGQYCSWLTNTCVNPNDDDDDHRLFALRGSIIDESNHFIDGAEIKITDPTHPINSPLATATSHNWSIDVGDFESNYRTSTFTLPGNSYHNVFLSATAPGKIPIENFRLEDNGSIIGYSATAGTDYDHVKELVMQSFAPGDAIISGKVTDKDGTALSNVTVSAKKNGFGVQNITDLSDTIFNQAEFKTTSGSDGSYSITIPSDQVGEFFGSNYQVCGRINTYKMAIPSTNFGCKMNSDLKIDTINVRHNQTYEANIIFSQYSYNSIDFSTFNLVGHLGELSTISAEVFCDNCGKGPWTVHSDQAVPEDYEVQNIYNIAQDDSTIDKLKIRLRFDYDEDSSLFYLDINNNYVKDDPEFPEITKTEIQWNSYVGADGKLYLPKDLNLRNIDETGKNFVVIGKVIKNISGDPIANANVTVSVPEGDDLGQASSSSLIKPNEYIPQASTNYSTGQIPLHMDEYYDLRIDLPDNLNLINPELWNITISPTDLRYNAEKDLYYYVADYYVEDNGQIEIAIAFRVLNQNNGTYTEAPLDLSKETIVINLATCMRPDNSERDCLIVSNGDSMDKSKIHYTFSAAEWGQSASLILNFQTLNYIYLGTYLDKKPNNSTYYITLANIAVNQSLDCRVFEEIEFCAPLWWNGRNEFFVNNREKIKNMAIIIKNIAYQARRGSEQPVYPVVYISNEAQEQYGAWSDLNNKNIGNSGQTTIITIPVSSFSGPDLYLDTVHETSHILDFAYPIPPLIEQIFETAIQSARESNCDRFFNRYDCFDPYGIRTNQDELRSVFMENYLTNQEKMKQALNDPTIPRECRNALINVYVLQYLRFPNLMTYQKDLMPNSSQSRSVSASTFDQLMSSAGFRQVQRLNFDVVDNFESMNLTPEQIGSGLFLQNNYNQLPLTAKLQLQLSIQSQKAKNVISRYGSLTLDSIRTTLSAINDTAERLLIALGFHISNTTISGQVRDQDGPVAGMMVKFSGKSDITGPNGWYSISRTRTGTLPLELSDPKIDRNYASSSPKTLTLSEHQKNGNANISFTRRSYTLSGRILVGNDPLRNGTISFVGGGTYGLSADGKFSFKLKEGQYRLIIKNKNGRVMNIVNPGTYGNINKIQVTKDYGSLIWVN